MNLFPFFQQFPKDHDQTESVILRNNNLFSNLSKGSFFSVVFPVVHCNWSLPLVSTNSWTSSLPLVSKNSWTLSKGFKTWKTWVLKLLTSLSLSNARQYSAILTLGAASSSNVKLLLRKITNYKGSHSLKLVSAIFYQLF